MKEQPLSPEQKQRIIEIAEVIEEVQKILSKINIPKLADLAGVTRQGMHWLINAKKEKEAKK